MTKGSGPNSTPPLNGVDGIPETTVKRKTKKDKAMFRHIDLFENENLSIFILLFCF